MKKIKLKMCDFWSGFNEQDNYLYDIISQKYDVEISDNPDYIIYSSFNSEHLKYNCIKIFFAGENIRPDFNLCDYSMGFDYLNYEDRYCRVPLYITYRRVYEMALNKHKLNQSNYKIADKFCDFVYSNNSADPKRLKFFNMLNKYKTVDSGGRYLNNVDGPVRDKLSFQKDHKFSIAFENSTTNGYITEKILEPFAAGSIPIYWGNPKVSLDFNPKAFINCHDYLSFDEVIELIKNIDNDDELYMKYITSPILNNMDDRYKITERVTKFLCNIFDQDYDKAFRRPKYNSHNENYVKRMKYGWTINNTILDKLKVFFKK